jgi:hypothetical protein
MEAKHPFVLHLDTNERVSSQFEAPGALPQGQASVCVIAKRKQYMPLSQKELQTAKPVLSRFTHISYPDSPTLVNTVES